MRITAQLIDRRPCGHFWSERYDRPFKDIFALQDEIVQRIVTTLKLQLTLQEQGFLVRKTTDNLEAYDSFLRGVEYFSASQKRPMPRRGRCLRKLYAGPAVCGGVRVAGWDLLPGVGLALECGPPDPGARVGTGATGPRPGRLPAYSPFALESVYAQKQQYDQAIAEGERAIALDPNNADSYTFRRRC